tara:strand:+ start:6234 stop:6431 length:198 start_codon:yes stop_codon:yes gene_type:complete
VELLSFFKSGSPKGRAFGGQADAHLVQLWQYSLMPKAFGISISIGKEVKILENRTLGPNSGVITI